MIRRRYESSQDRAAEQQIAAVICSAIAAHEPGELQKMPPMYPCDYAIVDGAGKVTRWIEAKRRKCTAGQYRSIMLSIGKLVELKSLYELTRIPVIFAVGLDDSSVWGCVLFSDKSRPLFQPSMQSRTTNTRDAWDIEPVAHLPWEMFKCAAPPRKVVA